MDDYSPDYDDSPNDVVDDDDYSADLPEGLGVPITISPMDVWGFLLPLRRYRFLDTNHFIALNDGTIAEKWIRQRLTELRKAGYIRKPDFQKTAAQNFLYRARIYENTPKADKLIAETGHDEHQIVGFGSKNQDNWHFMASVRFFVSLEIELRAYPHLRLVPSWEILERAPQKSFQFNVTVKGKEVKYVPDDVLGVQNIETKNALFGPLEQDLNTEPVRSANPKRSSIEMKYLALAHILKNRLYKSRLGLPNFSPFFLTTTERRKKGLVKLLASMDGPARSNCSFKVLTRLDDDWLAPKPGELQALDGWERIDKEPLNLSEIA